MAYNPATDFLALWRNIAGQVSKEQVPGLDYVVRAMARAGLFTLTVSATAPVANQATTAWLQTAVPSYSAEGVFFLWDKVTTAYLPATAGLFLQFMEATIGESGVSWWTTTGGAPANTVGLNGDYAIRTDNPGGIYGPKTAGAWSATPLPGTTNVIESVALDNAFGATEGLLIYRDAAAWEALPIGGANNILATNGVKPLWATLTAIMDALFSNARGALLYRGAVSWLAIAPGAAGQVLSTGGAGADPSWQSRTAEFPSGTVMLFQQTAAPPGWVKQVVLNDYALRVTSGSVGVNAGLSFTTVFGQTAVGNTTLSTLQTPPHSHTGDGPGIPAFSGQPVNSGGGSGGQGVNGICTLSTVGGGASHTHSVNLTVAYVDVIIATKS